MSKEKDKIIICGARVNNLKNITVSIPKNQLVVVTGLSGSGKSSLAFDVVYAEGQRRYLEGMSTYAKQFLDICSKPDVDKIENLSPTISIDQRSLSRSPRSTVGTLTEIYDYLRVLFSKIGEPSCPNCHIPLRQISNWEVLEEIAQLPNNSSVVIMAKILGHDGNGKEILKSVSQLGYARIRVEDKIIMLHEALALPDEKIGREIEIVVDRLILKKKNPDKERILDSVETAFKLGKGLMVVSIDGDKGRIYNREFICHRCYFSLGDITPKHFSFNNPEGACSVCSGLGIIREIDEDAIMPNKNLTLAEGAILPWNKAHLHSAQSNGINILKSLGEVYGFSVDVPVKKLKREHLNIILYGTQNSKIVPSNNGIGSKNSLSFAGVVPTLKKKYEELNSLHNRSDIEKYMVEKTCPGCQGKRLKGKYLSVLVSGRSIDDVVSLDLDNFLSFLSELEKSDMSPAKKEIIRPLLEEMKAKTRAMKNVGLNYLSLKRGADTLSGGEAQRIRLAVQLGSELSGIIYILDEPSIGLHNRDTQKLITTMNELRKAGNSLIVVEHDKEIIRAADWVIDMGPGAGEKGGEVIFSGSAKKILGSGSLTAQYINNKKKVTEKKKCRKGNGKFVEIVGAKEHNLKNISVKFPLEKFITVSGVSGSGKSTLVSSILSRALSKHFFKAKDMPGEHKTIRGLNYIDKVISVNQSPIGRTPRSNAATYTGVFSLIREIFASTQEARTRGYGASRFSFNMRGGRCEDCQGEGTKKIEMYMLPDMYVPCETCFGTRYNQKTLEIEYQGVNIAAILNMSVSYALRFFSKSPLVVDKLKTLEDVGLGYLKLGQNATNLSGGEAQRIKLATELARRSTGKTLYILDEPTIGLHFDDVKKLLSVLDALVDKGNTVLVVEHNTDVINNSDWVIELGQEGGKKGGYIIYEGTPVGLKKCKKSWTGKYL